MSTLSLFGSSVCPLSQSVQMTLDLLKLDYKYTEVNVANGSTCTRDFLALNPHKSVPVLVDSDLVITESTAGITYLVIQYSSSQLYPECAKKVSQIDQRLQFHIGRFYE
jgi:glutathione S-transferase